MAGNTSRRATAASFISDMIDEAAAARVLAVSIPTLRRWRAERFGPAYFKLGGRVCYRVDDLDQWVRDSKVVSA